MNTTAARDAHSIQAMNEWTTHEAPEPQIVATLADSMRADGWQGSPVLAFGDLAVTGTHRIAAAREAGVDVQTLDLHDVMDNADATLAAVMEAADADDTAPVIAWLFRRTLGDVESDRLGNDLDTRGMEVIWEDALDD